MARFEPDYSRFIADHATSLSEITSRHTDRIGAATLDLIRGIRMPNDQAIDVSAKTTDSLEDLTHRTYMEVMRRLTSSSLQARRMLEEEGDTEGLRLCRLFDRADGPASRFMRQTRRRCHRKVNDQTRGVVHVILDWRTADRAQQAAITESVDIVLANEVYPNVSCVEAGRAIACMLDVVRVRELREIRPTHQPSGPDQLYGGTWLPPLAG